MNTNRPILFKLSFSTSWQDLKDLFRKGGRVTHTDVDVDEETHRPKGSGLVIYDDPRDAAGAIGMLWARWRERLYIHWYWYMYRNL